ncbi:hypothetical protein AB0937_13485 [Streptomyces sp. NPDC047880]|uniref:hypothetical protein n=1 Tax=Streptomyces sp. NPDC047880 TaxID=3155626 RepID=UPI003456A7B0
MAIQEVRLATKRARCVEVVLTASPDTTATVYRLDGGSAKSAACFAEVVNGALPPRTPGTPPQDGGELVELIGAVAGAKPETPARRRRALLVVVPVLLVHLGGLTLMLVAGDPARAMLWGLGVLPLAFGALILTPGVTWVYDWLVLNRRGISVMATYARGFGTKRTFTYADVEGHKHEIKPYLSPRHYRGDPSRIEIVFDPQCPSRARPALPGRHVALQATGPLALGLPFFAAGLFLVPYQMVDFLLS